MRRGRMIALWVSVVGYAACATGCLQPKTPEGAEAAYTAEQLRCVDAASSYEEQEACRENVRLRWGRKKDGTKR
jgi:hypothetical protein